MHESECPQHQRCEFYQSISASAVLRIKYATMWPYCRGGKHESCMRLWMVNDGKPVPDDLLPDGARDWFAKEANRPTASTSDRVLVVDDLPLFRKALVGLVQAAFPGAVISEADSAEAALELLAEDGRGWACVVTDYNMGDRTGYDLIRAMRANPAHSQLPAIVFSSDGDEEKRARCAALPRVRWLPKRPEQQPFLDAWSEIVVERKA